LVFSINISVSGIKKPALSGGQKKHQLKKLSFTRQAPTKIWWWCKCA